MWRRVAHGNTLGVVLGGLLWLAGCASVPPASDKPRAAFPPQQVMEGGDYAGFLAKNRQMLERCEGGTECEVVLFNLGFVHA